MGPNNTEGSEEEDEPTREWLEQYGEVDDVVIDLSNIDES